MEYAIAILLAIIVAGSWAKPAGQMIMSLSITLGISRKSQPEDIIMQICTPYGLLVRYGDEDFEKYSGGEVDRLVMYFGHE